MQPIILFDKHSNIRSTQVPESITLVNYIDLVKSNPTSKFKKGTPQYDNYKRTLPAILVNGYFTKNPANERFIKSTGFIFLELDNIDPEMVEQVKRYWFDKYYFIVAIYKSLSQTGLHMIVKLDEKLTAEITTYKANAFNSIIHSINNWYFEGKLDTQAFKLTQYTILGSDDSPLYRKHFSEISLSVQYRDVDTISTKERPVANTSSLTDIEEFDNLSRVAKVKHILNLYPIFKERLYWYNYDYGRVPDYLTNAFTAWSEMNSEGFSDKFYYLTQLSSDYFLGSNDVIITDEPISTTCIKNFIKSKEGKRRGRLLIEASKVLFNNPFIGYTQYFGKLKDLNLKVFYKPLSDNEVEDVAVRQYKSFVSGSMKWNDLNKRKVFYPDISILEKEEKSRITQSHTFKERKINRVKTINKAIISLQNLGIKHTQDEVAKVTGFSSSTVKRHWEYVDKKGIKPTNSKKKKT